MTPEPTPESKVLEENNLQEVGRDWCKTFAVSLGSRPKRPEMHLNSCTSCSTIISFHPLIIRLPNSIARTPRQLTPQQPFKDSNGDPRRCTNLHAIKLFLHRTHSVDLKRREEKKESDIFGSLPRDPPDLTSLSSLSMEGEGTLDLGLPGREHSEPASKESSWLSISSSLTHLWQTLCWQGRINGWVKSSLQMGQISSRSMFLIGTWWRERERGRRRDHWKLPHRH